MEFFNTLNQLSPKNNKMQYEDVIINSCYQYECNTVKVLDLCESDNEALISDLLTGETYWGDIEDLTY